MQYRVLLCDDEVHIVRAAEFKLTRSGYSVFCTDDGQSAWEEIQRSKPDILITDFQMPRLDGIGLCRLVRANDATRDLPIIMLTAKGFELSSRELIVDLGVSALIAKPFSPRELVRMVDKLCGVESRQTVAAAEHS